LTLASPNAHVVLGFDAERVCTAARLGAPAGLKLFFHVNERWRKENGLSLLTARPFMNGTPFALLMGDHIFDPTVLRRLLDVEAGPETLIAIDSRPAEPHIAAEATKVRVDGDRVTAIGKELAPYDALDTGLFVCQPSVFDATERACAVGDTTLSGGIRGLTADGLIRGVEIGDSLWCDIDTPEDLMIARQLIEHRPV